MDKIEENFLEDEKSVGIGDVKGFKHNCIIKWEEDYQQENLPFDNYYVGTYYSIISNHHIGHDIAREICDDIKGNIIKDDGEYNTNTICKMIDEKCLNKIRMTIQNHVEEYLNNHLEVD